MLRYFVRPTEGGNAFSQFPVHTQNPIAPKRSMCGADLHGMAERSGAPAEHRRCVRCVRLDEEAEMRAVRAVGIVGGWEVTGDGWTGVEASGRAWRVTPLGKEPNTTGRSWCASVDGKIVRAVGHQRRTTWRSDAQAMRACEELARSGAYVLDRPRVAV